MSIRLVSVDLHELRLVDLEVNIASKGISSQKYSVESFPTQANGAKRVIGFQEMQC